MTEVRADKNYAGELRLRWAWLIPGLLVFAGAVGACDPPPAHGVIPTDTISPAFILAYQFDVLYPPIPVDPCPNNPDLGNSRAPFDPAGIEACIRYVWPDDLEDRAIAVVFGHAVTAADGETIFARNIGSRSNPRYCVESGGNPNAVGGVGEIGVMQLHPAHFGGRGFAGKLGYTKADAYDPETNIALGLELFRQAKSGWRQWTCAARSWGTGK